jgi:hypothetical protein
LLDADVANVIVTEYVPFPETGNGYGEPLVENTELDPDWTITPPLSGIMKLDVTKLMLTTDVPAAYEVPRGGDVIVMLGLLTIVVFTEKATDVVP